MAQLMRVMLTCRATLCRKAATWTVVGEDKQRYGPFCREHGMSRLEILQIKEDEARDKKRKAKR